MSRLLLYLPSYQDSLFSIFIAMYIQIPEKHAN